METLALSGAALGMGALGAVVAIRRTPGWRRLQRRITLRRAVSGFPRSSRWQRIRRSAGIAVMPRGPARELRVLRQRALNALESAGASALVLARLDRLDARSTSLIGRLRELGVRLDRRLALTGSLRDPVLLATEIATAGPTVREVERMAAALGKLATMAAGGTIDLEAAALRRELEAEVEATQAGLTGYRELLRSEPWGDAGTG